MTEQMITPEDIRVGNRIRIEWNSCDLHRIEEAVVDHFDSYDDPRTRSYALIGPGMLRRRVEEGDSVTITLLDRPTPPLPTEPGSVIHVSECRGEVCDTLALLDSDGWWSTAELVNRCHDHQPRHITAWEPREVVEVA